MTDQHKRIAWDVPLPEEHVDSPGCWCRTSACDPFALHHHPEKQGSNNQPAPEPRVRRNKDGVWEAKSRGKWFRIDPDDWSLEAAYQLGRAEMLAEYGGLTPEMARRWSEVLRYGYSFGNNIFDSEGLGVA